MHACACLSCHKNRAYSKQVFPPALHSPPPLHKGIAEKDGRHGVGIMLRPLPVGEGKAQSAAWRMSRQGHDDIRHAMVPVARAMPG